MFQNLHESNFPHQQFPEGLVLGDELGGESTEEIIWQRDPKIINYNWTKDATRLLIGLRTSLDAEFDDPNQKKMDLWDQIAGVLKNHGFDFPPSICDKKWRNLLVSFRRTVSRGTQGKINRFPYTWEFYTDLCEYWKKRDPAGFSQFELAPNDPGQEAGVPVDLDGEDLEENDQEQEFAGEDDEGDDDQNDDGDMNKFLTVTLSDSEDEPEVQQGSENPMQEEVAKREDPPPSLRPAVASGSGSGLNMNTNMPSLIPRHYLNASQSRNLSTGASDEVSQFRARDLSLNHSEGPHSLQQSHQRLLAQLTRPLAQHPNLSNYQMPSLRRTRIEARNTVPMSSVPSVTIEEVTPAQRSQKRNYAERGDDEAPFQSLSSLGYGSMRERDRERQNLSNGTSLNGYGIPETLDAAKRARRDRERDQLVDHEPNDLIPPAWFINYINKSDEIKLKYQQMRWEKERERDAEKAAAHLREFEIMQQLEMQKVQAMNRLTSAVFTMFNNST